MSKVGYLKPFNDGTCEELQGEIKTLNLHLKIKLVRDNMRTNAQAPDYTILADAPSGEDVEIGAAWSKSKQQSDGSVCEFLSITIDDLSLPQALNVAAFKQDDGSYEISWRRRRPQNQDAT